MARQKSASQKRSRSKRDTQKKAEPDKNQNGQEQEPATYEQELASMLQERIKPGLNSGAIPLLARSIAKDIASRNPPASEDSEAEEEFSDEPEDEVDEEATGEAEEEFDDGPEDEVDEEATGEAEEEFDDPPEDEVDEEATDDGPEDEVDEEATDEGEEDFDDEVDEEADDEEGDEIAPPPDFQADMQALQAELGEDWILRFSVQGDEAWMTAEKEDGSQRLEAPDLAVLADAVDLLNESGGRAN
jgi:hypothetical protein